MLHIYIYIYHRLEEITPLVTGVKSYIQTPLTGRNFAVSYRPKNRLEEITSLVTDVKSYIYTSPTGRNSPKDVFFLPPH